MKGRSYTILLISKGGKAPRNVSVSSQSILIAAALLVFVFAGIIGVFFANARLAAKVAQLTTVEEENSRLQAELNTLEQELTALNSQMTELEILGQEVRGLVSDVRSPASRGGTISRTERIYRDTGETLDSLKKEIPQKTKELELLIEDATIYQKKMEVIPTLLPVNGRITSHFGWRRSPFTRRSEFHAGVDLGAPRGTPVYAAAAGEVIQSHYKSGYGNLIIIKHGTYKTYYAHLRRFLVRKGERVEKGQQIGQVGSTGFTTGPHLHYEIHKNGTALDPLLMIKSEVPGNGT
jgi:murein DD-endopeptidase MepM/ murein hydrolase activator NlpD